MIGSWNDVADILNKLLGTNYTESKFRKQRQAFDRMLTVKESKEQSTEQEIENLVQLKYEIRKEKQKLFDERRALNKTSREYARIDEDLKKLGDVIREQSAKMLPYVETEPYVSNNDLFVCLSDFHYGLDVDNHFGAYNPKIAAKRLSNYISKIISIQKLNNSENAYVGFLGDLLNGEIHFTTQLENRENVTEQIQATAELLSEFVYELSKHFSHVYVNGVAGNHSRTSFKDSVLRGNRLDNLIPWYMKEKLSHLKNVSFIDDDNYDSTIAKVNIRGNEYLMVHGDYDGFNESGVSKLVMMLGKSPKGIFYGHLHKCSFDDISGVKIVRSGCFGGAVDDYTVSKRLFGRPSQMVCVIDETGIKACYPVELE